jgi:hypothetical protein
LERMCALLHNATVADLLGGGVPVSNRSTTRFVKSGSATLRIGSRSTLAVALSPTCSICL